MIDVQLSGKGDLDPGPLQQDTTSFTGAGAGTGYGSAVVFAAITRVPGSSEGSAVRRSQWRSLVKNVKPAGISCHLIYE